MASSLNGVAILVANDDYRLAQEACTLLSLLGAEVCGPVASVEDARQLLARRRVDGALLKLGLRDGSSDALASTLKSGGIPYACVGAGELPEAGRARVAEMTAYQAIAALIRDIREKPFLPAA